jgi:hypothetical protein
VEGKKIKLFYKSLAPVIFQKLGACIYVGVIDAAQIQISKSKSQITKCQIPNSKFQIFFLSAKSQIQVPNPKFQIILDLGSIYSGCVRCECVSVSVYVSVNDKNYGLLTFFRWLFSSLNMAFL